MPDQCIKYRNWSQTPNNIREIIIGSTTLDRSAITPARVMLPLNSSYETRTVDVLFGIGHNATNKLTRFHKSKYHVHPSTPSAFGNYIWMSWFSVHLLQQQRWCIPTIVTLPHPEIVLHTDSCQTSWSCHFEQILYWGVEDFRWKYFCQISYKTNGPVMLTCHLDLGRERDFALFHNFKYVYSPRTGA